MLEEKKGPVLDVFRILAAVLVVAIHTSPLTGISPDADFILTRVAARLAVPFFLMVTGYFLAKDDWRHAGAVVKKLALIYLAAILLYLPLNFYNGGYSATEWLQKILIDGTLYHLWYFPGTILGIAVVCLLRKLGSRGALAAALVLYALGLLGDSYYGLTVQIPLLKTLYDGIFAVTEYTRNGLFYTPLFLLLGSFSFQIKRRPSAVCFVIAFAAMGVEGWTLHSLDWQRHDSMYLLLPLAMLFMFSLLLGCNEGQRPVLRRISLLIYVLHPWCIVLVRGGAKLLRLLHIAQTENLLVGNALVHFLAVLALSVVLALLLCSVPLPRQARPKGRAWREIDLAALRHNAKELQCCLGEKCKLMAVVKAEAYGHGGALCARELQRAGVRYFAVAALSEAVALRKAGIIGTILVLGYTPPSEVRTLRFWHITQTVVDEAHAEALAAARVPIHVHIALDTGMHRLGIPCEHLRGIKRILRNPYLRVDGIFSHLCVSDSLEERDVAFTQKQTERFYQTVETLKAAGCDPGKIHLQASYGALNLPQQPCDLGRMGIALYGVCSDDGPVKNAVDLRPVLSLRARIASVRTLEAGVSAGYGLAFTAERTTRLAVAAIGYADGLPRDFARRGGRVLLRGVYVPIVGRLCMDQMLLDVTEVPEACQGDIVTVIGRDGEACIRAETVAAQCGTITNELLSRLGGRLPVVEKASRR